MDSCEAHDDSIVVYMGRHCPVCGMLEDAREEIAQLTRERDGLRKELEDADNIINHLESVYADYPEMEAVVRLRE